MTQRPVLVVLLCGGGGAYCMIDWVGEILVVDLGDDSQVASP